MPLRSRYFTKTITTRMKPCHMFGALSRILYLSKSAIQITEVYAAYEMPPCTPIPLIPHLGDTLISITQNLATALRYLRKTDCDRVLWIDAICINQETSAKEATKSLGWAIYMALLVKLSFGSDLKQMITHLHWNF